MSIRIDIIVGKSVASSIYLQFMYDATIMMCWTD